MKKLISLVISIVLVLSASAFCFGDAGGPTLGDLDVYVSNPQGAVLKLQGAEEDAGFLVPFGTKLTLDGFRIDLDFAPVTGSENSPLEDGWNMWEVKYSDISPFEPEMDPVGSPTEEFYAVITGEEGIDVFKGPDERLYEKCGVFPAGAVIEGTCYDSDLWAYAEYGGVKGWAQIGPYVTFYSESVKYYSSDSEELSCTAGVKEGGCDVYDVDTGSVIASLAEGDVVVILDGIIAELWEVPEVSSLMVMYGGEGDMHVGTVDPDSVILYENKVEGPSGVKDEPLSYYFGIQDLDNTYKLLIESENGTGLYSGPAYFYDKISDLYRGDEAVLMNIAIYRGSYWLYVSADGVRGWIPSADISEPHNLFEQIPRTWSLPLKESLMLRTQDEVKIYETMIGGLEIGRLPAGTYAECVKITFEDSYFPVYYVNYGGVSGWLDLNNTWAEFDGYDSVFALDDIFTPQDPGEEAVPPEEPEEPQAPEEPQQTPEEIKPEEPEKKEEAKPEGLKPEEKPEDTEKEQDQAAKPAKKMSLKTVIILCALAAAVLCATALVTIRLISCKREDKGIK